MTGTFSRKRQQCPRRLRSTRRHGQSGCWSGNLRQVQSANKAANTCKHMRERRHWGRPTGQRVSASIPPASKQASKQEKALLPMKRGPIPYRTDEETQLTPKEGSWPVVYVQGGLTEPARPSSCPSISHRTSAPGALLPFACFSVSVCSVEEESPRKQMPVPRKVAPGGFSQQSPVGAGAKQKILRRPQGSPSPLTCPCNGRKLGRIVRTATSLV